MEFTFNTYKNLLESFILNGYKIVRFEDYILTTEMKESKILILRHDVDRFPNQTLKMAQLEYEMGVKSTYFFRIIPSVFQKKFLISVAKWGHEIGYHYEDLTLSKGDYPKALESFQINLEKVREFYPVKTICMHGSPASLWDNKNIWKKYDYKKSNIIADTSLDINYNEVFYISDNGFGWNKTSTSIRDKVKTKFNFPIRNTNHFIEMIKNNEFPDKIMLNAHPDTFFDPGFKWLLNCSFIKSKNIVKWFIVKTGLLR